LKRPAAITALAVLYLALGALFLLLAVPAAKIPGGTMLFGSWVSARTYMYWMVMCGVVWLGISFCFFQGIFLGLWIYLGLKASHWGVSLLAGNLGGEALPALLLDGAIVFVIWKHRDWFQA
jgi:hypothetical protein